MILLFLLSLLDGCESGETTHCVNWQRWPRILHGKKKRKMERYVLNNIKNINGGTAEGFNRCAPQNIIYFGLRLLDCETWTVRIPGHC